MPAGTTDAQPARPSRLLGHGGLRRFGRGQHGMAMLQEGAATVGDGKAPGAALEQSHPQPLLQQGDAAAQRRFGQVQRPAGSGKVAVVGHGGKVGEKAT